MVRASSMLETNSTLTPQNVSVSWGDTIRHETHTATTQRTLPELIDNGLGGQNDPVFGAQRGEQISSLFLHNEQNCVNCWVKVLEFLTVEEISCLEPDIVIRTLRSHTLKGRVLMNKLELDQTAEKVARVLSKRVRWFKDFSVQNILNFQHPNSITLQTKLGITLSDIEQFRYQVIPLKLYGTSEPSVTYAFPERRFSDSFITLPQKHVLIKLRLKETKWFNSRHMFHVFSSKEIAVNEPLKNRFPTTCEKRDQRVLYLTTLLFEAILRRLRNRNCRSVCSDPTVYISGQFILVIDLEGLSLQYVKNFLFIDLRRFVKKLSKFYPQILKKVYLVNSPFSVKVVNCLKLLTSEDTSLYSALKTVVPCKDEKTLLELLQRDEKIKLPLLPVEYGGNYDGMYVLDLQETD